MVSEETSDRGQRSELAARLGRIAGLRARAAAQTARHYVAEHDDELRNAGLTAAQIAANRIAPPALRPLIHAAAAEFAKGSPQRPPASKPAADAQEPDGDAQEPGRQ